MVPLRSDTIRLVQNGCSFYRLWSEDPNQHLKDFLKLVDSFDIDGSITIWEDLTTRFLAQVFSPRKIAKLRNNILIRTIDQSADGKLRDHNAKESWALLEDLALYDNESWNDPRDFAKPVKAIALPQDVSSTSDRHLIELETQYCMENPKQAFVDYASSRTDEAEEVLVSEFMASQDARLSKFEADFKQQQSEMTNKIDTVLKAITDRIAGTMPNDTVKNLKLSATPVLSARQEEEGNLGNTNSNPHPQPDPLAFNATKQVRKLNSMLESLGLVPQASNTKFVCSKEKDREVMFIEIIRDDDEPQNESLNDGEGETTEGPTIEYFDTFPTRDELTYYRKLDPRENLNGVVSNFTGRIKGMHVFVGNFTYIVDFMIVEDISSIIDPRLSQVVLGRPFIEVSNMTHDLPEGVVRLTNENDEVAYKILHKIEQYNSLSNLEKEHIKSVYLMNEEDKRRGVDYAFGNITRDLGSFGEETDKTTDLYQHFSRLCSQQLETASQFLCDAVTTHPTTASQESMTASEIRT
nr:MAK10-like protein [Tanacetum cinerariifolium]